MCCIGGSQLSADVHGQWNLDKVHDEKITGKETVIAIIDTGIDLSHPAIMRKFNRKDIHGDKSPRVTSTDSGMPVYHCKEAEHGTAIAAIIAGDAVYENGKLKIRRGIAPNAQLYVYRLPEDFDCNDVHDALKHISSIELRIDIVCMPLGFEGYSDEIEKTLRSELAGKGVVCIAAVGNGGNFQEALKFPASSGNALSVGALTITGQRSDLNPHDNIDVFAIGENVIVPKSNDEKGKLWRIAHGTSYAAAVVAGFLSLMMQYIRKFYPVLDREFHNLSFLKSYFSDHSLCKNRELIYVDSYFANLLACKKDDPRSLLAKYID